MKPPVTPEGYEPVCGPVRSVPVVRLRFDNGRDEAPTGRVLREGVVTVGNRVRAFWQDFGHVVGNGTIVGFERHVESGWIKAVIDYDYPTTSTRRDEDGYERWDFDRVVLCPEPFYFGMTQEETVARVREQIAKRAAAA